MGRVAKSETRPAVKSEYLKGTSFDRIKNYYLDKIDEKHLSQKELELIWRWENIWGLYRQHLKTSVAIKYHIKMCEKEGYSINERTAWRDFQKATKIWGKVARIDRQAKLVILSEMAMDTYISARDKNKISQMNRAISNLLKINLQVEDYLEDTRDPHTYELHIHLDNEERKLDLNKLPVNNSDYKKILEELENEEECDEETIAKLIDEADQES